MTAGCWLTPGSQSRGRRDQSRRSPRSQLLETRSRPHSAKREEQITICAIDVDPRVGGEGITGRERKGGGNFTPAGEITILIVTVGDVADDVSLTTRLVRPITELGSDQPRSVAWRETITNKCPACVEGRERWEVRVKPHPGGTIDAVPEDLPRADDRLIVC